MNYNSRKFASAMSMVVLLGLAACGGDDDGGGSDSGSDTTATTELAASAPAVGGVTIAGFGFNTGDGVTAGQEFTVTNDDPASHTLTDAGGTFSVAVSRIGDSISPSSFTCVEPISLPNPLPTYTAPGTFS